MWNRGTSCPLSGPSPPPYCAWLKPPLSFQFLQLNRTLIKLLFDALITSSPLPYRAALVMELGWGSRGCLPNNPTPTHLFLPPPPPPPHPHPSSLPDMYSLIISFYECWSETRGKGKWWHVFNEFLNKWYCCLSSRHPEPPRVGKRGGVERGHSERKEKRNRSCRSRR